MHQNSLLPHQQLDWNVSRLEVALAERTDDSTTQLDLARAVLSRTLFHRGPEKEAARALTLSRKVLQEDPGHMEALVIAGFALVGMQRVDAADRYLDQAEGIDGSHALLNLARGMLAGMRLDLGAAVRHLEVACRKAPDAWETHLELGRTLMLLAKKEHGDKRLLERAQFHLVAALKLEPPPDQSAPMLRDLGVSCMMSGRHRQAEKFFIRLREHPDMASQARYHLGNVAYALGKYNNAIQHFRQYMREHPDDPAVLGRMALSWFQMGDWNRAREACHQALVVEPGHIMAKHVLGCTLLEEGEPNEAIRVFRENLKDNPGHMPSFVELARARRHGGDTKWLFQALNKEVGRFDRLPHGGSMEPQRLTRQRISVILREVATLGPAYTGAVLQSIAHSQDEALRFQLWEAACRMARVAAAEETCMALREPGRHYGPQLGRMSLAAADVLPEPILAGGLRVDEDDLKRGAVDRHPPAADVSTHRMNLERERANARAYQALLLVSIGVRRSPAGKALLRQWAEAADPELATAAWAALAMYGEPEATKRLSERALQQGAGRAVDILLKRVMPPAATTTPRRVSDVEETRCTTCGREASEVTHMMAGAKAVVCDRCVINVRQHRESMAAPDDARCNLCARSHFEVPGLYRHNNVDICSKCMKLSLGLLEREEVDRFLATW